MSSSVPLILCQHLATYELKIAASFTGAWASCLVSSHLMSWSGAEEGLNDAVVALKELLGEGCPWVGAVVRRLAQLHHIKGDAIMAEGLYGGAGGRFAALGEVDIPTSLLAEHVLQLVSSPPTPRACCSPPPQSETAVESARAIDGIESRAITCFCLWLTLACTRS